MFWNLKCSLSLRVSGCYCEQSYFFLLSCNSRKSSNNNTSSNNISRNDSINNNDRINNSSISNNNNENWLCIMENSLTGIWSIHEVTHTITPCSLDQGVRITPCLDKLVVLLLYSGWVFWLKAKTQLINVHFNLSVSMWLTNLLWFTTSLCASKIWLIWAFGTWAVR